MHKVVIAAVGVAVFSPPPLAYAMNFDFSFSGSGGGTITGEIFGLASSGESAAVDLQIFSAPSYLVSTPSYNGLPSTPFDIFSGHVSTNLFTVSAGHIVGAQFLATKSSYALGLNVFGGLNAFGTTWGGSPTANGNGFAGATYTPTLGGVSQASGGASNVPEPATILLFGAGLAGISAFRRRRMAA